jgi:chromate transport protein ChrA
VFAYWLMLSVLTIVTTFGIGIGMNMIFRRGWVSLLLYAILSVYLFASVGLTLNIPEWVLYLVGLIGVILASWSVRALKKRGYALFS